MTESLDKGMESRTDLVRIFLFFCLQQPTTVSEMTCNVELEVKPYKVQYRRGRPAHILT